MTSQAEKDAESQFVSNEDTPVSIFLKGTERLREWCRERAMMTCEGYYGEAFKVVKLSDIEEYFQSKDGE